MKQNKSTKHRQKDKQFLEVGEHAEGFRELEDPVVADVEGDEVGEVADALGKRHELCAREAECREGLEFAEVGGDDGHSAAVERERLECGELCDRTGDEKELAVLHGERRETGEREQGLRHGRGLDVVDLERVEPHVLLGRHEGEGLCGAAVDDERLERAVVGGCQPHVAAAEPLDAEKAELAELLRACEAEDVERRIDVTVFVFKASIFVNYSRSEKEGRGTQTGR